jgi:hypothetical protein
LLRLEPGAVASLGPRGGTQACVVLSGTGMVDGDAAGTNTSIRVDPGASARISSNAGIELVVFGLPIFEAVPSAVHARRETVSA